MKKLLSSIAFALIVMGSSAVPADEPLEIARSSRPNHPQQPQLAVDENGTIHLVFGVANVIKYCRSTNGGESFSQIVELANSLQMSLGMRRGPRVAATSNTVRITFVGGKEGKGREGDLLAMSSADSGANWTGPVAVNSVVGSAREGLHGMAAGPNGQFCSVWLDLRNKRTEVMASISTDGGVTWKTNSLVYQSPSGNVCECCHPSVCFDSKEAVFVLWRNSLNGARDMYWTKSNQTAERRQGIGEQSWIANSSEGPYVICLEKRGGDAMLIRPVSTEPKAIAKHAFDPVIVASPIDLGPVVAAWESATGDRHSIQVQVVRSTN